MFVKLTVKIFKNASLALIIVAFLLVSCDPLRKPTPPSDVMPAEKLVVVLSDMHMLEAMVLAQNISRDSGQAVFKQFRENYLSEKKIDTTLLNKSYAFYIKDPIWADYIYTTVADTLTQRTEILKQRMGRVSE